MSRGGTLHRCVAWLALAAMVLLTVMPAVSRSMPMSTGMGGMDAGCVTKVGNHAHPDIPSSPDDPTTKCGYCILLAHTPFVGMGALFLHLPPLRPASPLNAVASQSAPFARLLSARPRGPPSRVNA